MTQDQFIAPQKVKQKGRGKHQRNVNIDDELLETALPKLTPKQQKFVDNVLSGMAQREAYRDAYGSTMSNQAISSEAYKLVKSPRVAIWLAAAKKMALVSGAMSLDRWLADMQSYIQSAVEEGAYGTAIKGHQILGTALGFVGTKNQQQQNTLDGERLFQVLSRLLPPILGMGLWKQVEEKLAPFLLGGEAHNVRMIEGTSTVVKEHIVND